MDPAAEQSRPGPSPRRFCFELAALIAGAVVLAHVALLWALPFPAVNEPVYMAALEKFWNPRFLANDWTFSGGFRERLIFNALLGPFCKVASIATVTWIGRIVTCVVNVRALLRIGARLGLAPALAAAAISVWVMYDQALVGEAWVLGTFESKCIAFCFALEGIVAALDGKATRAGLLAGLTFTFHPAIGLSAAPAIVAGLWAMQQELLAPASLRALWKPALALVCGAVPGVIQLALATHSNPDATMADWAFVARLRVPHHLEVDGFGRSGLFLTAATLLFNGAVSFARARAGDGKERFLLGFQAMLVAIFAAGVVVHALHRYDLLAVFPFALAPLFASLLFFFNAGRAVVAAGRGAARPGLLLAAIAIALSFDSLVVRYKAAAVTLWQAWSRPADDLEHAFAWVATNVPEETVCALPPWRSDAIFIARRPTIAWWQALRYDGVHEWRARIEALGGDLSDLLASPQPVGASEVEQRIRDHYARLTTEEWRTIAARYDARYLVTESEYPFPQLFVHGRAHVYRLDAGS